MAEAYVELIGSTARFAGNLVSDLADDCSRTTVGRSRWSGDDDERYGRRSSRWNLTSRSLADDCVEVVDRVFDRFHDSLDDRWEDDEDGDHDARPSRVATPAETATSPSSPSSPSSSTSPGPAPG